MGLSLLSELADREMLFDPAEQQFDLPAALVERGGTRSRSLVSSVMTPPLSRLMSATGYALHCVDDTVPFVALWYGGTIALCTVAGAALGPRLLRW